MALLARNSKEDSKFSLMIQYLLQDFVLQITLFNICKCVDKSLFIVKQKVPFLFPGENELKKIV